MSHDGTDDAKTPPDAFRDRPCRRPARGRGRLCGGLGVRVVCGPALQCGSGRHRILGGADRDRPHRRARLAAWCRLAARPCLCRDGALRPAVGARCGRAVPHAGAEGPCRDHLCRGEETMSYPPLGAEEIAARLAEVAAEAGVRVLFAVESGSRAWGFASPDSDWDIRFVYAAPLADYLTVRPRRDVIEQPVDARGIDLAGWDVRKALQLLLASNPALIEWLQSPITYADDGAFRPAVAELAATHASRRALTHHYRSIARTHWERDLARTDTVKLKRYFYVLRAVAALAWVARTDALPPIRLADLIAGVDFPADARADLDDLLALKTSLSELGTGARRPALDRFISATLDAIDPADLDDRAAHRAAFEAEADALFRRVLGAA
ncbi:hypothetical protein C2U72_21400 [Prosthecomicrobium hirschii]|nr:hypothetical protein C2U72_21400 [Prosthecomicrobium hirschii]